MSKRPPTPPQLELYPGWLPSSAPAPRPELPFQRCEEIDVGRVQKILGISKNTVRRMLADGLFPGAYRIDGCKNWRIPYDAVLQYCNLLRLHYRISEDRLLRRPVHGRLRDDDLLPFPLRETVMASDAEKRLSIPRENVIYLIDSGRLTGYQILIETKASPWRIHEASLDRYIQTLHTQASAAPRIRRAQVMI